MCSDVGARFAAVLHVPQAPEAACPSAATLCVHARPVPWVVPRAGSASGRCTVPTWPVQITYVPEPQAAEWMMAALRAAVAEAGVREVRHHS